MMTALVKADSGDPQGCQDAALAPDQGQSLIHRSAGHSLQILSSPYYSHSFSHTGFSEEGDSDCCSGAEGN